jgi:DNA-binding response OmpR family regulator
MRILLLEEGSSVADELSRMLRRQGSAVEMAAADARTLRAAATRGFDLLILDLSTVGRDAPKLVRALADWREQAPMLLLTGREQVDERVQALELGADCLAEPFVMPELAARVRALMRRARPQEARKLVHGPLVLDGAARRASLGGEPLALLPREWAVLDALLRRADQIVSKESLIFSVAGPGKSVSANAIETYISRLRSKLEPAGVRIRTVHRVGYVLERPVSQSEAASAEAHP